MQKIGLLLFTALCIAGKTTYAQCDAPTSTNVTFSPAICLGQGSVTVSNTSPVIAGTTFQYALYDSANSNAVKPFQNDSIFTNVLMGKYRVRIRRSCPVGTSAEYLYPSLITVTGTNTPVTSPASIGVVNSSSTCNNGMIYTQPATGGAGNYQYALVPSLNEPEPVANYIQPKTSPNGSTYSYSSTFSTYTYFDSLAPGTYYLRSYDQCGNYATKQVVVGSVAENSASIQPYYAYKYTCDSVKIGLYSYYLTGGRIDNPNPIGKYLDNNTSLRFFMSYGTTTDTLLISVWNNSNTMERKFAISQLSVPVDSIAFTLGYKNECGQVFSRNFRFQSNDAFSVLTTLLADSCKQRLSLTPQPNSYYWVTGGILTNTMPYVYSFDSGATWSSTNNKLLNPGQTYQIAVANSCGDTVRLPYTIPAYAFNATMSQEPRYACIGKGAISFYSNGQVASPTNMDSITVISQPGNSLPAKFAAVGTVRSIDSGKYVFQFKDKCGYTKLDSIVVVPARFRVTVYDTTPALTCGTNYNRVIGVRIEGNIYDMYVRMRDQNGTEQVYFNQYNPTYNTNEPMYPLGTYKTYNVPSGSYTIKVWSWYNGADTSCAVVKTINSFGGSTPTQLNLGQSLFTSACNDQSATIVANATNGGGTYQYALYQGTGPTATQVVAPSSNNIFNNLNPNTTYEVRATDNCGNGAQFSTSFSNAPLPLYANRTTQPCPGGNITLTATQYPNGLYTWTKNTSTIMQSGASNSYTYNVPMSQATISDTFRVRTAFGTCTIDTSARVVLTPSLCGQPLPMTFESISGIAGNGTANVRWSVYRPEKVLYYELEYSGNGSNFSKVGQVAGSQDKRYSYTDQRFASQYFYRVKAVLKDGSNEYSETVALHTGTRTTDNTFHIYPTVAGNTLHIGYIVTISDDIRYEVVDAAGRVVMSGGFGAEKGSGSHTIDKLSALPNGTYFIQIKGNKITPSSHKFVVNN